MAARRARCHHEGVAGLRCTLLGTGSPSASLTRCQPAVLVEWGDGASMLVDAGDGVVAQLLRAGVALATVERVALTHLHWDHILGYPAFVWSSWTAGRDRLSTHGPAGTRAMHRQLVADFYDAQARWAIDLGYPSGGWQAVEVGDIEPGWSTEIDGCTISAGAVVHPPMPAVAYRFDHGGRSLVISGDTIACSQLVAFSAGADVLVADACASPPPPGASDRRRAILANLPRFHASATECVAMARQAGVGHVVLTHHLPDTTPAYDLDGYTGRVTVGDDLAVIEV
jgi:ribonuclease Z